MKFYENGAELAKDMGIELKKLEETHDIHYQASLKAASDPDGGPYPAYPSGKSWDPASGPTGSGKKFYHNVIAGKQVATEPFHVAIITPVIHYCMGGVEINAKGECLSSTGAIPGLYAAGEVAGGVHGNNRLGGNSLLDCVVFGRVCAKEAAKYMTGKEELPMESLKKLKELPLLKQPAAAAATTSKPSAPAAAGSSAAAPAAPAAAAGQAPKGPKETPAWFMATVSLAFGCLTVGAVQVCAML
mmetsp:Transcript_80264/g.171848  ORF Transcript_80264/g.171848 Transcript_80264/m.171848 type:complete len:244 (-) Transcript_80264:55-786(-)